MPFTATKIVSLLQLSAQGAAQAVQNAVSIGIRIAGMVKAALVRSLRRLKSFRSTLLVEAS